MSWLIGIGCFVGGFVVAIGLAVWFIHIVTKDFFDAFKRGWW